MKCIDYGYFSVVYISNFIYPFVDGAYFDKHFHHQENNIFYECNMCLDMIFISINYA